MKTQEQQIRSELYDLCRVLNNVESIGVTDCDELKDLKARIEVRQIRLKKLKP